MTDEFSEPHLNVLLARVDEWYGAFAQSPEFARLSLSYQREARAITAFFAQYTCEYLGLPPEEWDGRAVVECCTEIMPRKVSAELFFFEAIAPVLGGFFRFLDAQSLLPKAATLAKAVEEVEDEIVAVAEDRRHWGPAKHFAMAALESGVDIQDPASLDAFMLQYNLQLAAGAAASRSAAPSSQFFHPAPAEVRPVVPRPDSPYDPCPCRSGKKYKFCCKPTS